MSNSNIDTKQLAQECLEACTHCEYGACSACVENAISAALIQSAENNRATQAPASMTTSHDGLHEERIRAARICKEISFDKIKRGLQEHAKIAEECSQKILAS